MLAQALVPAFAARGSQVIALGRSELDVTDSAAVMARISDERPDAVVQCAAYTAVDAAEADEQGAFLVNEAATRYVASACDAVGAALVFPSTDYVFAGHSSEPYGAADATAPINVYGRSKEAGERAALACGRGLVVRTSWLYGTGGPNFVDTMRRLGRERGAVEVVTDQIGRPTWTGALAEVLVDLVHAEARGIFHATGGGQPVSWYGFAEAIFRMSALHVSLEAVSSYAFSRPAARPTYSVLDCSGTEKALGRPMEPWQRSLASFLRQDPS